MSPTESRLLEFVASRLESLLRQPAAWGSKLSIEEQVLQLLELRRVLLVPSLTANDTHRLMRAYTRFITTTLEAATAEPLAIQLERLGRGAELTGLLAKFIDLELAEFVADVVLSTDESERSGDVDATQRVIEQLRREIEAHERRRPRVHEAIDFPHGKQN